MFDEDEETKPGYDGALRPLRVHEWEPPAEAIAAWLEACLAAQLRDREASTACTVVMPAVRLG